MRGNLEPIVIAIEVQDSKGNSETRVRTASYEGGVAVTRPIKEGSEATPDYENAADIVRARQDQNCQWIKVE